MARIMQKAALFLVFSIFQSTFGAVSEENFLNFPKDLTFGVGSSAYQIEGAWNVGGKSPSNWDAYTHSLPNGPNGDVACDSYHKYKEDIKIIHEAGFDSYRMSLSWSRILPAGIGNNVSKEGVQYYKNVLDELHSKGIEPVVTIYHWDHPSIFDEYGGWTNSSMIDHARNYARIVFEELGSRVRFWISLNEAKALCDWGYGRGELPIGKVKASNSNIYICGENMLKAHAEIYHLYNEKFRVKNGKIGIVDTCWNYYPMDEAEPESADVAFQFNCGWMSHPIFSKTGDYPEVMKQRIAENSKLEGLEESRLPTLSPEWINRIKKSSDFFGLNYYTSRMSKNIKKSPEHGWFNDSGILVTENNSWPVDAASWLQIHPEGLGDMLRKIKNEYDNPTVHILENGLATDGRMLDISRIDFFHSHLRETLLAINRDKCNVKSYFVWSLLDGYEWKSGFYPLMGIVHVNHTDPNRPRKLRLSVSWLEQIMKSRRLISSEEFQDSLAKFGHKKF